MAAAFEDVKPWPTAKPAAVAIGSNSGKVPLDEQIVSDFMDALAGDGILARVNQLAERGKAQTACNTDDMAGRIGDFVKLATAAHKAVEAEREKHNRPLLASQRALKGKADAVTAPLGEAVTHVRKLLDGFMAEQRRVAAERQREAEAAARAAREAAAAQAAAALERAGAKPQADPEPLVHVEPVQVAQPTARGDYGARVGSSTVWRHKIESVRQLPDAILKHPKVIEALDKVIAAEVRAGKRSLKGVTIWDEQTTVIR